MTYCPVDPPPEGRDAATEANLLQLLLRLGTIPEIPMQSAETYNPVRARNIPFEMATLAQEKGESVTRKDLQAAGFTDQQIDKHSHDAAILFAQGKTRHAA